MGIPWISCGVLTHASRTQTHRRLSRAVCIACKWTHAKVKPVHVACYRAMHQRRNNAGVIEYFEEDYDLRTAAGRGESRSHPPPLSSFISFPFLVYIYDDY